MRKAAFILSLLVVAFYSWHGGKWNELIVWIGLSILFRLEMIADQMEEKSK